MAVYTILYRERGNTKTTLFFDTTVEYNSRKEALEAARQEFDKKSGYTVVAVYRNW